LDLVHEQGFHRTTRAEFAKASSVPLGNFYYYFNTKESLGRELIDQRMAEYRSFLAELERDPSPMNRLLGFVGVIKSEKDRLVTCGCPVGSLTQELAKEGGPLAQKAGAVFALLLDWITEQFRLLGYKRTAQALALQLMASLQGATVLANALRREDLLLSEANRLSRWIRELPNVPDR
jgi:AcrR family transcriptional regulator